MKLNPNDKIEIKNMIENLGLIHSIMKKNQRLFSKESWYVENIMLKLKARLIRS